MSQLFWTLSMSICAKLRDLGIEGLKDKINKLKEIEFLEKYSNRGYLLLRFKPDKNMRSIM